MSALYGLIGRKLSHSFSPIIHQKILKALQMDGKYGLYETEPENLGALILKLKHLNLIGANVTIPYKIDIMPYLDSISSKATSIGSVNTISFESGKLIGDNTDYDGFKMMMDYYDIAMKNKNTLILGTGGASKAIIQCLIDSGAKNITLVSRNPMNAVSSHDLEVISYEAVTQTAKDLIINCTPSGMYPNIDDSPLAKTQIEGAEAVVDLIYNPTETKLMTMAQSLRIKNINGLLMLIGQAIKAQEIWNKTTLSKDMVKQLYQEIILEIK